MNISQTLILGAVQGATEFLPVSSSAHLVIMQHHLGFTRPLLLFDAFLHTSTLLAVLIYFRKEIYRIALSLIKFKKRNSEEMLHLKMFYLIIIGTIPTLIIGLFLNRWIDTIFSSITLTSSMLIFTGILLCLGEKKRELSKGIKEIKTKNVLLIGLMQGIAIIPGVSRSGSTISVSLLQGIKKELAFRYSFLLSIPVISGALTVELREAFLEGSLPHNLLPWLGGALSAFIIGYLSLLLLKNVILKKKLFLFACYCWIVGGGMLILHH
ncbi:MAG: undecaprenyl-diphosphate phosphatase [Candidatus Aerophobetes bacterium]|nr:undecaprenyl-diphosphate phosphatase [Candidatus Aerophobetes bacterium]